MDLSLEPSQQMLSPMTCPWPPGSPFKDQHGQTGLVVVEATMDPPSPVTDDETEKQIKAAARLFIQAKYDLGASFFSKEVLRDVAEQLDRCLVGSDPTQKVAVPALDGRVLHFLVEVGKESRSNWPGFAVVRYVFRRLFGLASQLISSQTARSSSSRIALCTS
jgi:hypothetical protein